MRRPGESSGVIRPRTLGRSKAASPEPPPPPPPPPPNPSIINRRIVYIAGFALLVVYLLYLGRGGKTGAMESPSNPKSDTADQATALRGDRSGPIDDDSDDENNQEDRTDEKKSKATFRNDNDDEDEQEDDKSEQEDQEISSKDSDSDEEETGDSIEEEDAQPIVNKPQQREIQSSFGSEKRDRSKTIESYFVNFGGKVVDIDKEGSYKYVLVRAEDIFGSKALLVRGCPHKEGTHCKHADAFARAKTDLEMRGLKATVLGGGRITRHPSRHLKGQKEGYISIFGYSKTFGTCEECNKLACSLIKASYPDYGIKWANEGYLESDERKISNDAWTRC